MPFTTTETQRPAGSAFSHAAVTNRIVIAHSRHHPTIRYGAGKIDRVALAMIRRHGAGAARAAVERVNAMIDRGDGPGRDLWACVVHAIHENAGDADAADEGPKPRLLCLPSPLTLAWRSPVGT